MRRLCMKQSNFTYIRTSQFEICTQYFILTWWKNKQTNIQTTKSINMTKQHTCYLIYANIKLLWFTRLTRTTLRRLIFTEIYLPEIRFLLAYFFAWIFSVDANFSIFPLVNFFELWKFSNFAWTLIWWLLNMYFLYALYH